MGCSRGDGGSYEQTAQAGLTFQHISKRASTTKHNDDVVSNEPRGTYTELYVIMYVIIYTSRMSTPVKTITWDRKVQRPSFRSSFELPQALLKEPTSLEPLYVNQNFCTARTIDRT